MNPFGLATAILLAAVVAILAYRLGSLSRGGVLAAVFVGGLTFGAGGPLPGALLLLFFVSSSALSRFGAQRKGSVAAHFEKGGRRDQSQVLANGGLAALLALAYGGAGEPALLAALAGALAAANADTWATELGVLAGRRPRLVTTGRTVEPGTSGAITPEGTLAAVGGAALIAIAAGWGTGSAAVAAAVVLGGFIGATADSVLGATVQAIYFCPRCGKETERHPWHTCGETTRPIRGWAWLDNDWVNFLSSCAGAAAAAGMWMPFK